MLAFIIRRLFLSLLTVWAVTIISFAIIQLPPGDYVSSYVARLMSQGEEITQIEAENLRVQYGLDKPFPVQYYKWLRETSAFPWSISGPLGRSSETDLR